MSATNPFIVCKAAAGSGKTFTLVREYLRLALAGDEEGVERRFRSILAITFTNKAAGEMKSRILESLDEMAVHGVAPEGSRMGGPLLESLNGMEYHRRFPLTESDLKRRAGRLRTAILHRYSDLSVSTIDSFTHRIVRTFAHDLGQPVNFEVMIDKDDLIGQAVSGLMSFVGTEGHEDLTRAVAAFAVSRMESDKGFAIEGSLTALASQLFAEGAEPYLELLKGYTLDDFQEIYRSYVGENRRFEQRVRALGAEGLSLLNGAGMDEAVCDHGKTGYLSFFGRLASGVIVQPNSWTVKVFEASDYGGARLCKAKAYIASSEGIAPRLREIYYELQSLFGASLADYNTRAVLLTNLYSMALLGELDRCLHAYARESEVLHLSEFNKLINRVVREEEAPFIYERLGSRYRHFLIDEFQDTSVLQWHNLVPLLENGVSQGYESLVVGDGKQAIYRFRQGDVGQFIALPRVEGIEPHGRSLERALVVALSTNYRTLPAIVHFNNDFFSWAVRNHYKDNELARRIYLGSDADCVEGEEELRQELPPWVEASAGGYVEATLVSPDAPEAIAAKVLEIVKDLVDNHGYRYKDIMVLGRTKRELAAVGSWLLERGQVPQSSAESFYLRRSQAVMALVAALRVLADPADRVAAADLLVRLTRLGIVEHPHWERFLERGDDFDLQRELRQEGIGFRVDYLLSLDLYDCCESLVRVLKLDGADTPYVASFLNRAAAYSSRHSQGIGEFLQWFDDHPDLSAACTAAGDAVRLMTIHKAKGLEAPVVICPFYQQRPKAPSVWVDVRERVQAEGKGLPAAYVTLSKSTSTRFDADREREQEASAVDDLNVLYVAFTRPRERLYIVATESKSDAMSYGRLLTDYFGGSASVGDPCTRRRDAAEEEASGQVAVRRLSYPEWTEVVQVASPAEQSVVPLMEDPVRFGIYAHELLSGIQHEGDVDAALGRFESRLPGGLPEADRERLRALASEVVASPLTRHFFCADYEVKNECDLTDGAVTGRPDRIVITPDETWVVDFKTGKDLGVLHDRQLQFYCRTLEAMGYPRVTGWLIYLQPEVVLRPVARG